MELKLNLENGRQTFINVKNLSQSEVESKVNDVENTFGSPVVSVNQTEVEKHGMGGFIIGAVAGGYLANLVMNKGVSGAAKTIGGGAKKAVKATAKVVDKVVTKVEGAKKSTGKPKVDKTSSEDKEAAAFAKRNVTYLNNGLIRSIDLKSGKRVFNKDIIDGAHLKEPINVPANSRYKKSLKELSASRKLTDNADYLKNNQIDSVNTSFGKTIPASKLVDGTYIRKGVKFKQGGSIDTGSVSKEDFFLVIQNWVYFTFNYPHNFVKAVFGSDHFDGKFTESYNRHSSHSAVIAFWHELSTDNQETLSTWIKNNYLNNKEDASKLKAISDKNHFDILKNWNRFCYNFPSNFTKEAFRTNASMFEDKFSAAYQAVGSKGAVNKFFTDLSENNQNTLTDWLYDQIQTNKFADGGSTEHSVARTILSQLGGGNRIAAMTGANTFIDGGNYLSFKIKNAKANYIKIKLNSKDLYDVEISRIRGFELKPVKTFNDVYAEDLIKRLEEGTGMAFRLEYGGTTNEEFGEGGSTADNRHTYMMLDRLRMDNDYFLGNGARNENVLWGLTVDDHIAEMKKLWNSLPADGKPEWLTMEQIEDYEKEMKKPESELIASKLAIFDTDTNKVVSRGLSQNEVDYLLRKRYYPSNLKVIEDVLDEKLIFNGDGSISFKPSIDPSHLFLTDNRGMFELGGRITESHDSKYYSYDFENKGNTWNVLIVWGRFNYVAVLKKTNNPGGGRMGTDFKTVEAAMDHYKDMNIKSQILFAAKEAEKHGYVAVYKNGGRTNDRNHVNHDQDYEVRYAMDKPARKGYKGSRRFAEGGGVDKYPNATEKALKEIALLEDRGFDISFYSDNGRDVVFGSDENEFIIATQGRKDKQNAVAYFYENEDSGLMVLDKKFLDEFSSLFKNSTVILYTNAGVDLHSSSNGEYKNITIKKVNFDSLKRDSFARGGHVSKGEHVWKKLSSVDKMKFLSENFTPQITPRSQELLSGKAFNFLPKNVKIVLEAKYANVEEYAEGGSVNSLGGNYLSINSDDKSMRISLTEDGKEEVIEMREDGKSDMDIMDFLFEDIVANSELVWHRDLGESGLAMTSASGVTDGYYYEDDGSFKSDYRGSDENPSKIYFFNEYATKSEVDELLNGELVLHDSNLFANGGAVEDHSNKKYLNSISPEKRARILKNIANHYGISVEEAEEEVTDVESEALYEYITDNALRMEVYNGIEKGKFAEGGLTMIQDGLFTGEYKGVVFQIIKLPSENSWFWKIEDVQSDGYFKDKNKAISEAKEYIDYNNQFELGGAVPQWFADFYITSGTPEYQQHRNERLKIERKLVELMGSMEDFEPFFKANNIDPVQAYVNKKFMDYAREGSINEAKAKLIEIAEISPLAALNAGRYAGISTSQVRIEYAEGGSTSRPMNAVKVIFENPEYNYTTSVASGIDEAEARKYFIGKQFNVGVFPQEIFERVIDIEYTDGSAPDKNVDASNKKPSIVPNRYIAKSTDGYVFADPEKPNSIIATEFPGIGIFDTVLGMFVNLSTDGVMKPYTPAGGYDLAESIANQMNDGSILQAHIYTVPHLLHKYQDRITLRPLEIEPLSTQLNKLSGFGWASDNWKNEDGSDASAKAGNLIENPKTGHRWIIPPHLYNYVDGENLYISTYGGSKIIRTYPQNYMVAEITDEGTLDFSVQDKSISLDKTKVKEAFEKGLIPASSHRLIDMLKNRGVKELPDYLKNPQP